MADQRNRDLFLDLLSQHEAQLLGFLCAITPNYQDAEDLFQQTVLTMWQKFGDFEPGTNFVAWGCRIARNKVMNHLKAKRAATLDDDILDLLVAAQAEEDGEGRLARRRALTGCLRKLSDADRQLVESAYTGTSSIKALAADSGRSPGGVYNSLARIRASLFRCIEATLSREGYA